MCRIKFLYDPFAIAFPAKCGRFPFSHSRLFGPRWIRDGCFRWWWRGASARGRTPNWWWMLECFGVGVAITCTSLVVLALYVYIWSHVHGSSSIPMNWTFLIRSDIFPKQLRIQHLQTFLQRWPRRCWPAPTGWEEGEDWPGDETSRDWAVGLRVTRLLYTYIPFQRAKVFEVTVTSRPRSFQLPQTIEDNPWSLSRTNPFQFDLYQNHCDKQQKNQWSTFEKRESTSLILWRHKRSSL